jgi:hypothetical protein
MRGWRFSLLILFHMSVVSASSQHRTCSFHRFLLTEQSTSQRAHLTKEDDGRPLFIPVVVHVVYNSLTQNIGDEQIYSQIRVLNEDFNRTNLDSAQTLPVFQPVAANCSIRFFLTTHDEYGNPTSGIVRVQTGHGPFADEDIYFTAKGGSDAWDTERFLNVWITDLSDGVFGVSSFPGGDPTVDGVVIDYKFLGTSGTVQQPFDKGRTTTHEVGHWLGLQHLWGEAGGCITDDGITDTPMQSGPSSGCNLEKTTCGNLNMVQNFMDLSDDRCMNMFTKGQRNVMRNILLTKRQGIPVPEELVTSIDEAKRSAPATISVDLINSDQLCVTSSERIVKCRMYNLLGMEWTSYYSPHTDKQVYFSLISITGLVFIETVTTTDRKIIRFFIED